VIKYIVLLTVVAIISIIIIKSSTASELPTVTSASRQLIVVITPSWNDLKARVYRFEKSETSWRKLTGIYEAVVGSKGMAWGQGFRGNNETDPVKKEGDRRAPAGIFGLVTAMGYTSTPPVGITFPYEQIKENSFCVDDMASHYYNRIIKTSDLSAPAADLWKSAETLKRKDDLYKWLIVVDHNVKDPKPGAGSCIFIHVWRSPEKGTAGCTAMTEKDVVELMTWLKNDADPALVQLPRAEYNHYWREWNLPDPAGFLQ
jgi:L,D-peptidoglycan transpeptidase YkuD (ErfK/YbiS/YcfS/YnhG family)